MSERSKKIGTLVSGSLQLLQPSPALHPGMIPLHKHLRHFAVFPALRPGILRVFQKPVPVAFAYITLRVGQHPGYQPANRICDGHGGDLAPGQDKVTK